MVSSGRLGIYFRGIARMQGWSQDLIKALSQGGNKVKVKDIVQLYIQYNKDIETATRSKSQGLTQRMERSFQPTKR